MLTSCCYKPLLHTTLLCLPHKGLLPGKCFIIILPDEPTCIVTFSELFDYQTVSLVFFPLNWTNFWYIISPITISSCCVSLLAAQRSLCLLELETIIIYSYKSVYISWPLLYQFFQTRPILFVNACSVSDFARVSWSFSRILASAWSKTPRIGVCVVVKNATAKF